MRQVSLRCYKEVDVQLNTNVVVMNSANIHNDGNRKEEQINNAGKQQIDLEGMGMSKVHNLSDVNVIRKDESITGVIHKSEFAKPEETEPLDKAGWR